MRRFLFKPVDNIIEKRRQEADRRFAEAQAGKVSALEEKDRYETLLKEAEDEKEKILELARQDASGEYNRIVNEARDKAEAIEKKARAKAQEEKTRILQQADLAVKEMAVAAVARMMAVKESPESDRALYDKFLTQAEAGSPQKTQGANV